VVSKFAAAALAECVAHDVRAQGIDHVGVSCLVPGSVDTRIGWSDRNRPDEAASEATAPDHVFVAQALQAMTTTRLSDARQRQALLQGHRRARCIPAKRNILPPETPVHSSFVAVIVDGPHIVRLKARLWFGGELIVDIGQVEAMRRVCV
jgi:NAD(P)-dependent dehydrogenase (short-subunit alcohol dehydrogenase family)